MKELSKYIDQNSSECSECSEHIQDPSGLVGKHISLKFETEDTREIQWYHGTVVAYDTASKTMKERRNIAILTLHWTYLMEI